MTLLFRR